jgi:2-dehydropantoate 2-reductase
VGGFLAVRIAGLGHEVSVVDRGKRLAAIRGRGLRLIDIDGTVREAKPALATDRCAECGPQDLVILAMKAHQIAEVAGELAPLLASGAPVVTTQNGIPWWYFHRHGGPHDGLRLRSLDPDGTLERLIPCDRVLGCIVYPAIDVDEPGVVRHVEGDRLAVGEPDGSESARAIALNELLTAAGFRSRVLTDLRSEIWLKAWGNLSFNPISALTRATLVDICRFPETRALAASMMTEAQAVAARLGITFRHTIEARIAGAENVGAHKTSMLQDLERGRSLELDALVGSILELARLVDVPVPTIEAVHACAKLLDRTNTGVGASLPYSPRPDRSGKRTAPRKPRKVTA